MASKKMYLTKKCEWDFRKVATIFWIVDFSANRTTHTRQERQCHFL
eukprot:TRINITY_DN7979_c0_g1_i1.p2 TRINITY_DN7979_c0_g1~~TRINITY_DN7979_c0_g1_i1.p2  ORF type:complete len:55 (-),score=3.79 TRINITY_DN7979_c0_g1_i1:376-513(-)